MPRSLAVATLLAVTLTVPACGGADTPSAEQALAKVQAACADHAAAYEAGPHASPTGDFIAETSGEVDPIDLLATIRATKGPRSTTDSLHELADAAERLWGLKPSVRSALEQRKWDDAQTAIDDALATVATVDTAADQLGAGGCSAVTFVGDWFDRAQTFLDAQRAASAPTGDFTTDVQNACTRLLSDIEAAPTPTNAIDAQTWALDIEQALNLFVRDVQALDVPADQQGAVDAVADAVASANASLEAMITAAAGGFGDPAPYVNEVQTTLATVAERVADLGVQC